MIHYLKTWLEPFNLSLGGLKPFEIRVDDRGFAEGDQLCLQEYDQFARSYTGRELWRRVTCVIRAAGPQALPDGLVVLGVEDATLANQLARQGAFLHDLGQALGVPGQFGEVEEAALYSKAVALRAKAGEDPRLSQVLELVREAHGTLLLGSAPRAKECMGEAARQLNGLLSGVA